MTRNGRSMNKTLRIGVMGLGTVGQAVIRLLQDNADRYAEHSGCVLKPVAVSARNRNRARDVDISTYQWYDDPCAMVADVDMIIEVAGGLDTADSLAKATLSAGKHWVSANKALLAEQGRELVKLAQETEAKIGFEAAVCTALPVVKTLREALGANRVGSAQGIFNGTCNYIAAQMAAGLDFDTALQDATEQGYAEADPTLDIGGGDAAHKTALMAGLIAGGMADFSAVHVEGVDQLPKGISAHLAKQGYVLKLLGQCRPQGNEGWAVWVYPAALPQDHALARVDGVTNAVAYRGDAAGMGMLQGVGAGGDATASAVLADVLDIASGRGVIAGGLSALPLSVIPIEQRIGDYLVIGAEHRTVWQDYDAQNLGDMILVRGIRESELCRILHDVQHEYWIRCEG